MTGAVSAKEAFLAVTNPRADGDGVAYGFLRREGRTESLVAGERRVERDAAHGWVTRVTIDGTDAAGRSLTAVGEPVSRMIVDRRAFIDVNSLLRWTVGGRTGWGEDQDMWPVHDWAALRRRRG